MRASGNTPCTILLASSPGIRAAFRMPLTILLAGRPGIRLTPRMPVVILPASRFGIFDARMVSAFHQRQRPSGVDNTVSSASAKSAVLLRLGWQSATPTG